MSTAHSRREAALEAIHKVLSGIRASDAETELIDFKLEVGSKTGPVFSLIGPRDEPAAKALAVEAACFANAPEGGVLIVGVDDKLSGSGAFLGANLDVDWLTKRIFQVSGDALRVEVEVLPPPDTAGKRIYIINVPPAMAEVKIDGRVRNRHGSDCVEVTGDEARRLAERRRGYDWSGERSGQRASNIIAQALGFARELYRERHGRAPSSDLDLLRQMGVLVDEASGDPELNRAGALLLCEFEPKVLQFDTRVVRAEGARSHERMEGAAPVLLRLREALEAIQRLVPLQDAGFKTGSVVRRQARDLPDQALREVLVNAIAHRDYQLQNRPITVMLIGEPPRSLKVESPGGFPPGVTEDNLLTTQSHPRNRALFSAMRALGLGDQEGVGIDGMYTTMIRDGHNPPEIRETADGVACRLDGGPPNLLVRDFFEELENSNPGLKDAVRPAIALWRLRLSRSITVDELMTSAQCSHKEAADTILDLVGAGTLEATPGRPREYRLTGSAVDRLQPTLEYRPAAPAEERWTVVEAYLKTNGEIGTSDVEKLFSLSRTSASRLLSHYRLAGHIRPVGETRGRNVRYRLA